MARREQCEFLREDEHTLESAKLKTTSTTLGVTTGTATTSLITRVKDFYYKVRHRTRSKVYNSMTLHTCTLSDIDAYALGIWLVCFTSHICQASHDTICSDTEHTLTTPTHTEDTSSTRHSQPTTHSLRTSGRFFSLPARSLLTSWHCARAPAASSCDGRAKRTPAQALSCTTPSIAA